MDVYTLIDDVNELAKRFVVMKLNEVSAKSLGLDPRAGYSLYVNQDVIVVDKHSDRSLQYYGGFEYVDVDYRSELGDYVFYTADDDRVRDCIECYYESQKEKMA
jgi:hypothetical protein